MDTIIPLAILLAAPLYCALQSRRARHAERRAERLARHIRRNYDHPVFDLEVQ